MSLVIYIISIIIIISVVLYVSLASFVTKIEDIDLPTITMAELQPKQDIYVMNGFYDYRISSVRIFIYSPVNFTKISCSFEYKNSMKECNYYYKPYRTFNTPYGHLIIPIKDNKTIPEYVILNNKRIKVNIPLEKENKYNLTLCVCNLLNFGAANRFIQTVESYRRFGVDHFTLYLTSASHNVMKVIKYYQSINVIELITGNKTFENIDFIKDLYYGHLGKLDDCIYRNMKQSKGVISVDIDEIIWPVKHDTLIKMINSFKGYNGFSFRSFHFHTEIINAEDHFKHNIPDTDIFIYREYCRYKYGFLAKNIYGKLDTIKSIFVHWPIDYTSEYKEINVPYETGYIRHIRRLKFIKEDSCETNWTYMEIDKREKEINSASIRIRKMLNINPPENINPLILIKKKII